LLSWFWAGVVCCDVNTNALIRLRFFGFVTFNLFWCWLWFGFELTLTWVMCSFLIFDFDLWLHCCSPFVTATI
jgi:hypothetical protein